MKELLEAPLSHRFDKDSVQTVDTILIEMAVVAIEISKRS